MYRDHYEQCPRCRIDLIDSGSVRTCTQCTGHWVSGEVLREMAEAMLVPARPYEVELVSDRHPRMACPTCDQPMETWRLHDVPIDRCPGHGLWFDRTELQAVLYAASGRAIIPERTPTEVDIELDSLGAMLKREL